MRGRKEKAWHLIYLYPLGNTLVLSEIAVFSQYMHRWAESHLAAKRLGYFSLCVHAKVQLLLKR